MGKSYYFEWDYYPHLPNLTVYEPEDEATDTGLLDAHGRPLYRKLERIPMGFDLRAR